MFTGIEVYFPSLNISDIPVTKLQKFAEAHNDQEAILYPDSLPYTVARVTRREIPDVGKLLHVFESEEGITMILIPDVWGKYDYDAIFESVYPYLKEIGVQNLVPFMGVLTDYDEKYFKYN